MKDNYQKLFDLLPTHPLPLGLGENIKKSILKLERRALFLRKAIFGGAAVISLVGLYPSASYALNELAQSSFAQYFSLLSSDGDLVFSNGNEFFYSLAESFPIVGGTLVLVCFLLFFIALDKLLKPGGIQHGHYPSQRFI